jgi:hypothetical protein
MKYILCLTIVLCISLGSLTAQQNYFIAGDTLGVWHYEYNPWIGLSIHNNTYDIDIDLDGTNDFTIKTFHYEQGPDETYYIRVLSSGNNKVGWSYLGYWIPDGGDTLGYSYMGVGLQEGDTINEDILFTNEDVDLIYKVWAWGFGGWYYEWIPGIYIPVCLRSNSSDCIYGWIKVYDVSSAGIKLIAHAVDITPTTVYVSPQPWDLYIYPNPAKQELNISNEVLTIDEVIIYTLAGQKVIAIRPKSESIDISTLQPGMYIVEVTVEGKKLRQKLLVQH